MVSCQAPPEPEAPSRVQEAAPPFSGRRRSRVGVNMEEQRRVEAECSVDDGSMLGMRAKVLRTCCLKSFNCCCWSLASLMLSLCGGRGNEFSPRPCTNTTLMRFVPVLGRAGLDDQRHGQRDHGQRRFFHDAPRDRAGRVGFVLRRFEHQFVMHLKQHARA